MTRIIERLSDVAARYDALFVDLWGCVHDGIAAFPDAIEALRDFRLTGGAVVLLTNAPRPRAPIARQMARIGVPDDCWDAMATSGDSARAALFRGVVGKRVYFIGEEHDQVFFSPLKIIEKPVDIIQVPLDEAEGIVCCGPFNRSADPSIHLDDLTRAHDMGLKLLCANPDIVVDRGHAREWCAGAVARLYSEIGGQSLYFGKPHAPIYDLARRRLAVVRQGVTDRRTLAIGDGIMTDIRGAVDAGIDSIFITGGLAKLETATADQPESDALARYLTKQGLNPTFAMGYLR